MGSGVRAGNVRQFLTIISVVILVTLNERQSEKYTVLCGPSLSVSRKLLAPSDGERGGGREVGNRYL